MLINLREEDSGELSVGRCAIPVLLRQNHPTIRIAFQLLIVSREI